MAKVRRDERGDLSTIQYFLKLMQDYRYHYWYISEDERNAIENVFFARERVPSLHRSFPYLLYMDTTYKTNKYDMHLL
ncbi:hypothetical protein, partial [Salmonella enterica]|uniref:hypothetical protein n=1 Tax=Salmonella enterica TaxID=28901 RepID=UPI001F47E314